MIAGRELDVGVLALAFGYEAAWQQSYEETGNADEWPKGCCVEAAIGLRDELKQSYPQLGARYAWGRFVTAPFAPDYTLQIGHAWVELGDTTIIDVTARQFTHLVPRGSTIRELIQEPVCVVPPGALALHWIAEEFKP